MMIFKIKKMLFPNWKNGIVSTFLIAIIVLFFVKAFNWLVIDSVLIGDAQACRNAQGACLAYLKEKIWFILFGLYPREELWRPVAALIGFFILLFSTLHPKNWKKGIIIIWFFFFLFAAWLMYGGFGLTIVQSSKWGGLPLTLILSVVGLVASYPLGILLALGRRGNMLLIKTLCVTFIELVRGVPLISVLFMSSVMFPLFMPEGIQINKLLRAQVAIILFISAYIAEVVRGGLQSIPTGQWEAAEALGMTHLQTLRFIIVPQALRVVVPPTVNTAIGMFKDTSLVVIIALFDLMGTTKSSLTDYKWLGFSIEAYLFTALIYFTFCFSMGAYGRFLEKYLNKDLPA